SIDSPPFHVRGRTCYNASVSRQPPHYLLNSEPELTERFTVKVQLRRIPPLILRVTYTRHLNQRIRRHAQLAFDRFITAPGTAYEHRLGVLLADNIPAARA